MLKESYERYAPQRLYRISFGPDALILRAWENATVRDRSSGALTFGHRWDDPEGVFRALYTSQTPVGAYAERLQDLRPDAAELEHMAGLELQADEEIPAIEIPRAYFENLYLCTLNIEDQQTPFIDVLHADVIAAARNAFEHLAHGLGTTISAATMLDEHRELTQRISHMIWSLGYAGITAPSKLGLPHANWTIFETGRETGTLRAKPVRGRARSIELDDPDLVEALNALHLRLDTHARLLHFEPRPLRQAGEHNNP